MPKGKSKAKKIKAQVQTEPAKLEVKESASLVSGSHSKSERISIPDTYSCFYDDYIFDLKNKIEDHLRKSNHGDAEALLANAKSLYAAKDLNDLNLSQKNTVIIDLLKVLANLLLIHEVRTLQERLKPCDAIIAQLEVLEKEDCIQAWLFAVEAYELKSKAFEKEFIKVEKQQIENAKQYLKKSYEALEKQIEYTKQLYAVTKYDIYLSQLQQLYLRHVLLVNKHLKLINTKDKDLVAKLNNLLNQDKDEVAKVKDQLLKAKEEAAKVKEQLLKSQAEAASKSEKTQPQMIERPEPVTELEKKEINQESVRLIQIQHELLTYVANNPAIKLKENEPLEIAQRILQMENLLVHSNFTHVEALEELNKLCSTYRIPTLLFLQGSVYTKANELDLAYKTFFEGMVYPNMIIWTPQLYFLDDAMNCLKIKLKDKVPAFHKLILEAHKSRQSGFPAEAIKPLTFAILLDLKAGRRKKPCTLNPQLYFDRGMAYLSSKGRNESLALADFESAIWICKQQIKSATNIVNKGKWQLELMRYQFVRSMIHIDLHKYDESQRDKEDALNLLKIYKVDLQRNLLKNPALLNTKTNPLYKFKNYIEEKNYKDAFISFEQIFENNAFSKLSPQDFNILINGFNEIYAAKLDYEKKMEAQKTTMEAQKVAIEAQRKAEEQAAEEKRIREEKERQENEKGMKKAKKLTKKQNISAELKLREEQFTKLQGEREATKDREEAEKALQASKAKEADEKKREITIPIIDDFIKNTILDNKIIKEKRKEEEKVKEKKLKEKWASEIISKALFKQLQRKLLKKSGVKLSKDLEPSHPKKICIPDAIEEKKFEETIARVFALKGDAFVHPDKYKLEALPDRKLPEKAIEIMKAVIAQGGVHTYACGGVVRDTCLRRNIHKPGQSTNIFDFDFVTEATPEEIQKALPHAKVFTRADGMLSTIKIKDGLNTYLVQFWHSRYFRLFKNQKGDPMRLDALSRNFPHNAGYMDVNSSRYFPLDETRAILSNEYSKNEPRPLTVIDKQELEDKKSSDFQEAKSKEEKSFIEDPSRILQALVQDNDFCKCANKDNCICPQQVKFKCTDEVKNAIAKTAHLLVYDRSGSPRSDAQLRTINKYIMELFSYRTGKLNFYKLSEFKVFQHLIPRLNEKLDQIDQHSFDSLFLKLRGQYPKIDLHMLYTMFVYFENIEEFQKMAYKLGCKIINENEGIMPSESYFRNQLKIELRKWLNNDLFKSSLENPLYRNIFPNGLSHIMIGRYLDDIVDVLIPLSNRVPQIDMQIRQCEIGLQNIAANIQQYRAETGERLNYHTTQIKFIEEQYHLRCQDQSLAEQNRVRAVQQYDFASAAFFGQQRNEFSGQAQSLQAQLVFHQSEKQNLIQIDIHKHQHLNYLLLHKQSLIEQRRFYVGDKSTSLQSEAELVEEHVTDEAELKQKSSEDSFAKIQAQIEGQSVEHSEPSKIIGTIDHKTTVKDKDKPQVSSLHSSLFSENSVRERYQPKKKFSKPLYKTLFTALDYKLDEESQPTRFPFQDSEYFDKYHVKKKA